MGGWEGKQSREPPGGGGGEGEEEKKSTHNPEHVPPTADTGKTPNKWALVYEKLERSISLRVWCQTRHRGVQ